MTKTTVSDLDVFVDEEISEANTSLTAGDTANSFRHLERAHVLGQGSTFQHVRVHALMLRVAFKRVDIGEIWGQIIRIIGAATKTPFGIYPTGNTGGANVWFFKRMPIPDDLQEVLRRAKMKG